MYFSIWNDVNASQPFESITHTLNPNSDFRFKLNNCAKKIIVKTWAFGGILNNFLEEESEIEFDNETNLITSEIRKSYYSNKPHFKANFIYDEAKNITEINRVEILNDSTKSLESLIIKRNRDSMILETESHIYTHTYKREKLTKSESYLKDEKIFDYLINIFYNSQNRISRIETYSWNQDLYNKETEEFDKTIYFDEPKLFFVSEYEYLKTDNNETKIIAETFDLAEKTSDKKIYYYDEYNNKIIEETLNSEGKKKSTINFLYEFDNLGNWVKLTQQYTFHKTNTTEITKVIERKIEYNDFC